MGRELNRRPYVVAVPRVYARGRRHRANTLAAGVGDFDFGDLFAPLKNLFVTSPFGGRSAPIAGASTSHKGIDYRAAVGTPVYSAAGGTVQFAGVQSGYGNVVVVDHGGGVITKYAHLSAIGVSPGDAIAAGAQLGASGQSGNVTGPHLHFELDVNGVPVDPSGSIMSSSLAAVAPGATPSGWEADPFENVIVDDSLPDLGGGYIVADSEPGSGPGALEIGLFAGVLAFGLWAATS